MSLRGIEPQAAPPGAAEPGRRNPILIAGIVAFVLVAGATLAAITGHLPFVGKPTVTKANDAFGWVLTFPRTWDKAEPTTKLGPPIRFVSQGGGVGVKVQAQLLTAEMPPGGTTDPALFATLEKLEKNIQNRPDLTFIEGPGHGGLATGTIHNVPFVHYLITYTDFSSGIPILLEDSDYFFFNGAKEEQVTFETDAKDYKKHAGEFTKAVATFQSRHITQGATPPPSPSPAASPAPAPAPAKTGTPQPSTAASPSPAKTGKP
ncbi:MAG: hypothetical protein NVSMB32_12190 [Actinomycetota bacterium]